VNRERSMKTQEGEKNEKKRMNQKKIGSSQEIEEEDENSQNRNDFIHI